MTVLNIKSAVIISQLGSTSVSYNVSKEVSGKSLDLEVTIVLYAIHQADGTITSTSEVFCHLRCLMDFMMISLCLFCGLGQGSETVVNSDIKFSVKIISERKLQLIFLIDIV